jgi:hypothetical protein
MEEETGAEHSVTVRLSPVETHFEDRELSPLTLPPETPEAATATLPGDQPVPGSPRRSQRNRDKKRKAAAHDSERPNKLAPYPRASPNPSITSNESHDSNSAVNRQGVKSVPLDVEGPALEAFHGLPRVVCRPGLPRFQMDIS